MNNDIGIYVINLITAQKRKENFIDRFKTSGANINIFNWYQPERNQENPEKGCFDSHQKVVELAKNKGYNYALIFEDDAIFLNNYVWNDVILLINNFLNQYENQYWKYFSLGYFPIRTRNTNDPKIIDILCGYDGHAYLVNLNEVKPMIYNGKGIDDEIFCQGTTSKDLSKKIKFNNKQGTYGSNPIIFGQELKDSFINNLHLGQKEFIGFYNNENNMLKASNLTNTYHIYSFVIITFILLIVLCIIILLNYRYKCNISYRLWFLIFVLFIFSYIIIFIIDYKWSIDQI